MDIEKLKEAEEYLAKCFMYVTREEPDGIDRSSNFEKHKILKELIDEAIARQPTDEVAISKTETTSTELIDKIKALIDDPAEQAGKYFDKEHIGDGWHIDALTEEGEQFFKSVVDVLKQATISKKETVEPCEVCRTVGFPDYNYCPNCGRDLRT